MSTLAVIVLVVVAVLLLAMLVAGARRSTRVRTAPGPHADGLPESRSHAEASRRGDAERL